MDEGSRIAVLFAVRLHDLAGNFWFRYFKRLQISIELVQVAELLEYFFNLFHFPVSRYLPGPEENFVVSSTR